MQMKSSCNVCFLLLALENETGNQAFEDTRAVSLCRKEESEVIQRFSYAIAFLIWLDAQALSLICNKYIVLVGSQQ